MRAGLLQQHLIPISWTASYISRPGSRDAVTQTAVTLSPRRGNIEAVYKAVVIIEAAVRLSPEALDTCHRGSSGTATGGSEAITRAAVTLSLRQQWCCHRGRVQWCCQWGSRDAVAEAAMLLDWCVPLCLLTLCSPSPACFLSVSPQARHQSEKTLWSLSLQNLTGSSAAVLPSCLSKFHSDYMNIMSSVIDWDLAKAQIENEEYW